MSELYNWNVFWSYPGNAVTVDNIDDEMLIEKVLTYLDLEDINKLFTLYSGQKIRHVWKTRLCVQEPFYHGLNCMLGSLYFDVKNPARYLKKIRNQHVKSIKQTADEWVGATYGENF
jgi:hypothetical protein